MLCGAAVELEDPTVAVAHHLGMFGGLEGGLPPTADHLGGRSWAWIRPVQHAMQSRAPVA
jgi:hypothetical protein